MDKNRKLADVLRSRRHKLNLTQEKAAELLDISSRWYQELESGNGRPGFRTACKLAKLYNMEFEDFANEEEII